jgi:hypothetical protein
MMQRCGNPNDKSFSRYGARGIRVCERWRSFENFLADMGPRPSPTHSIDRIDNALGYEPGNCRWATAAEQNANRRLRPPSEHLVLARELGVAAETVKRRLAAGRDPSLPMPRVPKCRSCGRPGHFAKTCSQHRPVSSES